MEDIARGERIKALRKARRLTQPAVVDLLHERAGEKVVSLRGYQDWEVGGGIKWEKVKLLAAVLDTDAEYLMSGEREEAPDLMSALNGGSATQLDRIELRVSELRAAVAKLAADNLLLTQMLQELIERGRPQGRTGESG